MALKTSTGRLYMLFHACLPQNEKVEKRLLVSKITESQDYNELASYEPAKTVYEEHYSRDKLVGYDENTLKEAEKAIPLIVPAIQKLINAIRYGNGWSLTPEDKPDFMSSESINGLTEKLIENQGDENVTNISDTDCLKIFDAKTIKKVGDMISNLRLNDLPNLKEILKSNAGGSMYCFDASAVNGIKEEFETQINDINRESFELKHRMSWFRLMKLGVAAIALLLFLFVALTLDLISGTALAGALILIFVLIVLYIILG